MPVFSKQQLLSELMDRTELVRSNTNPFLRLTNEQLNAKPARGKWCISEIFEHLNITQGLYIKSILTKMSRASDTVSPIYKSGWLGDLVYTRIMPRPDGTVFKLKTPKILTPENKAIDGHEVLNNFLHQLDIVHDILQHAATKDIQRIKIPVALTNLIKLRLGDNLRLIIAHNERHILQAKRVMETITSGQ
jgi:hypothetical protein